MQEEEFGEWIYWHRYPDPEEFDAADFKSFLGWFLKTGHWSTTVSLAAKDQPRDDTPENTGDLFGVSSLDEDWVTLNQMIKYYKFGFGRATDYVNEEIRLGRMSREEGIATVEKYDGKCSDRYIESFCDYINISTKEFWKQVHDNLNHTSLNLKAMAGLNVVSKLAEDLSKQHGAFSLPLLIMDWEIRPRCNQAVDN